MSKKMAGLLLPDEKYSYCIHCEKATSRDLWLRYDGCPACLDASPLDAWSWDMIAKANDYPEEPEFNKKYPMYPN